MGKQHELLAVVPSLKQTAYNLASEASKTFQGRHEHFSGLRKFYTPLEEGGNTFPEENKPRSTTVGEKLAWVCQNFAAYLDTEFSIDSTNCTATTPLNIGGIKIEDVPVTFLMQLEKHLVQLRTMYARIPTLDANYEWNKDSKEGLGVFKTPVEKTFRTEKKSEVEIIVQPTDKFPAQTREITVDKRVGEWNTTRWSGMITTRQKSEVLRRIDTLLRTVKKARSEANNVDHKDVKIGEAIFDYINGPIELSTTETASIS